MKTITVDSVSDRVPRGPLAEPPYSIPRDHVGPYFMSGLGKTVWWTGRVAIGLRYEPLRDGRPAAARKTKA